MARVRTHRSTLESHQAHEARRKQRLVVIGCGVAGLARGDCHSELHRDAEGRCAGVWRRGATTADAEAASRRARRSRRKQTPLPRPERPKHDVMAVVNGQDISRDALAAACVERFGEEVLEGLVNKRLIDASLPQSQYRGHRRRRSTPKSTAWPTRFKIGREQWLRDAREGARHQRRSNTRATSSGRRSPCASWRPTSCR